MKVGPTAMKTSERIALPILYLAFCAIFVIAGLDHRTHRSSDHRAKLTSTGPYAIVRHPMYAGSLLYLLGIPLALG